MPFPRRDAKFIAKMNHTRVKYRNQPAKTEEEFEVISMGGCWCGGEYKHDWLGKEEGEPHPR